MQALRLLPALAVSAFLLHCAKIEPPPGGPVDKTGPTILNTDPRTEAVAVPAGDEISVDFSEKINAKSIEGAIFISPHTMGKLRYKWQDRTLIIKLPHDFTPNTTYVVNIGSGVADLRNNRMEKSHQFAFSTGESIDRGKVSGMVFQNGKPVSGVTVAVYDTFQVASIVKGDSIIPPFLTQTGNDGEFLIDYLPAGRYFLFAFQDKNKNLFFDFPDEPFGIPDRFVNIDSVLTAAELPFTLSKTDTSGFSIQSITLTENRLVRVRLSRPLIYGKELNQSINAFLTQLSSGDTLQVEGILPDGKDSAANFNLYFRGLTSSGYKMILRLKDISRPDTVVLESAHMEFRLEPDVSSPRLEEFSHKNMYIFPDDSLLRLTFSEPVDMGKLTESTVTVIKTSDSSSVKTDRHTDNLFLLTLATPGLAWGEVYLLRVNLFEISDLAGNSAGDTVLAFTFRTYDNDSLGAVSGKVSLDSGLSTRSNQIYLSFQSAGEGGGWRFRAAPGTFNFQLPPGKYLLSAFLDENQNGIFDAGALRPFHFSEVSISYPDTVRVRARFETAGVELNFR